MARASDSRTNVRPGCSPRRARWRSTEENPQATAEAGFHFPDPKPRSKLPGAVIYHRHKGGNHPHVHRDHHGPESHPHGRSQHTHASHDDRDPHGHPLYDVNGRCPAVLNANANEPGHWHFDTPFECIALAPICDRSEEFTHAHVRITISVLGHLPQAARPPPCLV